MIVSSAHRLFDALVVHRSTYTAPAIMRYPAPTLKSLPYLRSLGLSFSLAALLLVLGVAEANLQNLPVSPQHQTQPEQEENDNRQPSCLPLDECYGHNYSTVGMEFLAPQDQAAGKQEGTTLTAKHEECLEEMVPQRYVIGCNGDADEASRR